ncbi:MAG: helix-turn-helix domain-containing protein [Austwickia sp.]|nr:helix-turn-helix domain-containing protein [Austwickia sp.]
MTRQAAAGDVQTYVPDGAQEDLIQRFLDVLGCAGGTPEMGQAQLLGPDGERVAIPEALFPVLRQVAETLAQGMGVTVAPLSAMLTTQEAADFLGISRPTFVRILERDEIPYEKPGRHRYVRLVDLIEFQRAERETRRAALEQMARDAEEMGLYEATEGVPPRMR